MDARGIKMRLTRRAFIKGLLAIAGSSVVPPLVKKVAWGFVARKAHIYVGTDGNDASDGLSWATRVQTLNKAVSLAQPGDTIWVGLGTYRECVTLE